MKYEDMFTLRQFLNTLESQQDLSITVYRPGEVAVEVAAYWNAEDLLHPENRKFSPHVTKWDEKYLDYGVEFISYDEMYLPDGELTYEVTITPIPDFNCKYCYSKNCHSGDLCGRR